MQVLLYGRVGLYDVRGDYQFIAEYLEPAGDGLLQKKFNELKQALFQQGLFDEAHKKPLPPFPQKIGVITSPTGAAIHDIIHVLNRRFPLITIIIYPTSVQGTLASAEITAAIELANARQECDVLIVGRGGGSLEDLWPFNEENVARAIFNSTLPIISAVGHEVDITIADFVSDYRAPTPSAAAEIASPDRHELQYKLDKIQARLKQLLNQTAQTITQQLDYSEQKLKNHITLLLQSKKSALLELSRALNTMSPLATLDRGYALVLNTDNQVISSIHNITIHPDQNTVFIQLKDGKVETKAVALLPSI